MITSEGSAGPIVIDIGSSNIRAGFAGAARPSLVESTILGSSGDERIFPVSLDKPRSNTDVRPIWSSQSGSGKSATDILDDDALLGILQSVIKDEHSGLRLDSEDAVGLNPILISEPSVQNSAYRQKVVQILFEKLGARAAFVCKRSVLSAFSVGKTNAIVVSSGAAITSVSCVVGGHASQHFYSSCGMAGNSLEAEIRDKLRAQNPNLSFLPKSFASEQTSSSFKNAAELMYVRRMKEEVCRVAENKDIRVNVNSTAYELPDGTLVDCNKIAQSVPETLFSSKGKNIGSLVAGVIDKQRSSDESLASSLLSNVVVCGGTSAMTGFTERVQNDLSQQFASSGGVVKCHSGQTGFDRQHSAWIGGSIVASLGAFGNLWITKKEYDENGVGIVGKKCP